MILKVIGIICVIAFMWIWVMRYLDRKSQDKMYHKMEDK
jgi:hypothetical protein|tara:strand:+ start:4130 stop:4246 length:117 start_codon:yes stop_codon:yes gene_type:complete